MVLEPEPLPQEDSPSFALDKKSAQRDYVTAMYGDGEGNVSPFGRLRALMRLWEYIERYEASDEYPQITKDKMHTLTRELVRRNERDQAPIETTISPLLCSGEAVYPPRRPPKDHAYRHPPSES